jgi:DNA-binding winged helix-turn-helix (wHTH) protein
MNRAHPGPQASTVQHTVYHFDRFQLDVTRRKLLSAGGLVQPLNSRAMEALLVLVANAGQVIDRRRLMQAVWPDTVVEDNNLNQCILAIRRALGETAGSNRYVMTVQGRGFCFVCPVQARIQESAEQITASLPRNTTSALDPGWWMTWPGLSTRRQFWTGVALGALVATLAMLPFALH